MNATKQATLRGLHEERGARFGEVNGAVLVMDYGDASAEHAALRGAAGVIDLSARGRVCLLGADRVRFLHGQVTNDVQRLRVGEGCYAALVSAKGRMISDLNIFVLPEELLLDFEPGLTRVVTERLEKYIVADDVQVVDVAPHYGLVSVHGPKAGAVVQAAGWFDEVPAAPMRWVRSGGAAPGEIYLVCHPRVGLPGYDVFAPVECLEAVASRLLADAEAVGGKACGWVAFEVARVEAGIPRFGADMDARHLPPECGIEERAVSYRKGCYIGQEVLNRIHSIGHVNRRLCGLRVESGAAATPARDQPLFKDGREVGRITSAVFSPTLQAHIALGYVRRELAAVGTELALRTDAGEVLARVTEIPFVRP
ncbi:MAG: aminomethyltransferase family protein [Verrucomicrobiae bacterium]|nr:aminomethyltransferase family protein [Verrucomicrobiae bacterium]